MNAATEGAKEAPLSALRAEYVFTVMETKDGEQAIVSSMLMADSGAGVNACPPARAQLQHRKADEGDGAAERFRGRGGASWLEESQLQIERGANGAGGVRSC